MNMQAYFYLSMVAVKEEYRGKGIGSFAIRNCLDELSQSKKTSGWIGLTTQLTENVLFYSKLGFEKREAGKVTYKKETYYSCNMRGKL